MELDAELRAWQERPLWEPGPGTFPVKYGRAVVEQILPHRPPFLLVDAITRIDVAQGCLRGQRRVDADDPVFAGHFPGDPIYPEVLQVEMLAQLGLCLLYVWRARSPAIPTLSAGNRVPAALPRVEIHHALFAAAARPGDGLTLLVRLLTADEETACCAGQVRREDTVCAVAVLEFHATRGGKEFERETPPELDREGTPRGMEFRSNCLESGTRRPRRPAAARDRSNRWSAECQRQPEDRHQRAPQEPGK